MRIQVTENNNIKHDNVLYVAGTVFEADDASSEALIETGAAVEAPAENAPEAPTEPTYAEVKERAQALGLSVTGKKDELLARVEAAEAQKSAQDESDSTEGDETPENAPEA